MVLQKTSHGYSASAATSSDSLRLLMKQKCSKSFEKSPTESKRKKKALQQTCQGHSARAAVVKVVSRLFERGRDMQ